MSRHSPKEIERIKRIAASADFGKPMAQGSLAATPCSVFEAVDASSDEQYYTCGIWLTFDAAIAAFRKLGDNEPGEDIADGVKIIEIRERKIGELDWSETGNLVAKFVWRKDYREADDSYEWRLTETPNESSSPTAGGGSGGAQGKHPNEN